jgi:hypothetical protein
MAEFIVGAGIATYLLIALWLGSDRVRGWEWVAVIFWPVAVPLMLAWRARK